MDEAEKRHSQCGTVQTGATTACSSHPEPSVRYLWSVTECMCKDTRMLFFVSLNYGC